MIFAIDFDGTCVTHEYPRIGAEIGAVPVLKELVEAGHQLILWTMRSDNNGFNKNGRIQNNGLTEAVNWFKKHDIPLYGIQSNPAQHSWTSSPKCYAQVYIDDAALGCPLMEMGEVSDRPFVDWTKVRQQLIDKGYIKDKETGYSFVEALTLLTQGEAVRLPEWTTHYWYQDPISLDIFEVTEENTINAKPDFSQYAHRNDWLTLFKRSS